MAAKTTSKNHRLERRRPEPEGPVGERVHFFLLELVALTFWGRIFLVLLIIAFVALINIAISKNQYDLFFRLTGI